MKFITWDIGILAALGVLLAYSLLIRKHKALATLVSVYVAYPLAITLGDRLSGFLSGDRVIFNLAIQAHTSPVLVKSVLLVLIAFLLSAFMKLGGRRSRYAIPEIVVYAICTLAVLVMFIISFMPSDLREVALSGSKILPYIYSWRDWVLGLPVFLIIFFGIYGDED